MSLLAPARGTQNVALRIVQVLARDPAGSPDLHALSPLAAPRRAVAVDGSSIVLAGTRERQLAAFRAGSVGVENGRPMPPQIGDVEVVLLDKDARKLVVERLEADGCPSDGLPKLDAGGVLDALRTVEETRAAMRALDGLGEGDVLLIDGALQVRPHAPLLDRVLAQAAKQEVDVIGVCKSTSITLGAAPALVACQLAARSFHAKTWYAPLPTPVYVRGASYAACLSTAEARVFRFDLARGDPQALARVAGLCGHPAYPGYPSPLAMAHNAVLLNDDARRRLLSQVQEAALAAGADPRAWEVAFVDYHDILELGA